MAGKAINQYNEFTGNANAVNVLVQETSQTDPNTYEHKKANLATLINSVASVDDYVEGYYYNGAFYEDSAHTTAIVPTTGRLYGDLTTGTDLYRWNGSAYVSFAPDLSPYATKAEVEEDITDVKSALTAVDHRVQNLESAKGDYVAVDSAKGVITTPSGKGKWAVVEKLRGVSRADNQLCYRDLQTLKSINTIGSWSNNVYTHQGISYTVNNDGSITVSGTSTAISLFSTSIDIQGGTSHRYLVCGCPSGGSTSTYMFGSSVMGVYDTNGNGNMFTIGGTTHRMAIRIQSGVTVNGLVFHPTCRDLTLYFGSTVPTLAEIQTYYPWLLESSNYGTSLVDSVYEGVRFGSKNLCDPNALIVGYYDTNGLFYDTDFRSSAKIKGEVGKTYSAGLYDSQGNYVSNVVIATFANESDNIPIRIISSGTTVTLEGQEKYISVRNFRANSSVIVSAGGAYMVVEGTYLGTFAKYYTPSILSLPSIKLRSAGGVYNEVELNVEVDEVRKRRDTTRVGQVDLGTLTWTYSAGAGYFASLPITNPKLPSSNWEVQTNLVGGGYSVGAYQAVYNGSSDLLVAIHSSGAIWLRNNSKNNSDLVNGHASWLEGVKFNYILATESVTLLDPIENPTILTEPGGTISAQTEEPIDGNFSVGFITL